MDTTSLITEPLKVELLRLMTENCDVNVSTLVDRFRSCFFPGERIRFKLIKRNGKSVEGVVIGRSSCSLKNKDSTPSTLNEGQGTLSKLHSVLTTYDIKADDRSEVISSVLGSDIERCSQLPNEETLSMFVRMKDESVLKKESVDSPSVKNSTVNEVQPKKSPIVVYDEPIRNGVKRKLDLNCVVSLPKLPKVFASMSSSKLVPRLKLIKINANLLKQTTSNNGKKLKQMTLYEMTSKMTSINPVKNAVQNATAPAKPMVVLKSLLERRSIPEPKRFIAPPGFPNDAIGDSLSVIEFVICYREFLRPEKSLVLSFGHFLAALVAGPDGFFYLNQLLVSFLRVLVQDGSMKYKLFKIKLSTLPISIYSAGELARLCLMQCSDAETKKVSDITVRLETEEFFALSVVEKVTLFVVLCNEVMDTPALTQYKAKMAAVYADLLHQKIAFSKENVIESVADKVSSEDPHSIKGVYGSEAISVNESQEESDGILVVRNERLEALKAAKEKQSLLKKEQELMMRTKEKEIILVKYKDVKRTLQKMNRINSLGTDRNDSIYWLMIEAGCGLLVERFRQVSDGPDSDRSMTEWCFYDTVGQLKSLVSSMSNDFTNEHILSRNLKKNIKVISEAVQQPIMFSYTNDKVCNGDIELEEAIYEEMVKIEKDAFKGSLMFNSFRDEWFNRMEKAKTCNDFAVCLLDLSSHVPESALDADVNEVYEKWKAEVQQCRVLSRLYVLIHVFLSFIQWNQLPKNATCGVCNRRNQRSLVVICKRCRAAFHANCLDPPLLELPESGLFDCPQCEDSGEKEEGSEVEEEEGTKLKSRKSKKNPVCCNSTAKRKGDVVSCSSCQEVYHKICHKPPLRNTPRGGWLCSRCTNRKTRKGGNQRH